MKEQGCKDGNKGKSFNDKHGKGPNKVEFSKPPKPCFICDEPYWTRECLNRKTMNALVVKFREANDGASEPKDKAGSSQQINALSDIFSPKKMENKGLIYVDMALDGKLATTMLDTGAIHNFMDEKEALHLGLDIARGQGSIKAVNSKAMPTGGIVRNIPTKIGHWQGTLDFTIVTMDD